MVPSPDTAPTELRHGSAHARCSIVPWDTRIMGTVVGQIDALRVGTETETGALLADVHGWADATAAGFMACRLDHRALRESMALESIGFRTVETILRPVIRLESPVDVPWSPLEVARAGRSDLPALEAIARRAFTTGRFAMDWRLPARINADRYAAWVHSSVANEAHRVHVARQDGVVVGVFVTERRPDDTVYWHLTAIDPDHQGRGLGKRLWLSMLRLHREEGARSIETRISGHNTAVLNLYAGLGSRFLDAETTLHWVRPS